MQIQDFKNVISTFADPGSDFLFERSRVVISVNGDLIDLAISAEYGDVFVEADGARQPASKWIINRLARVPLLAARLRDSIASTEYFVSPSVSLQRTLERDANQQGFNSADALATSLDALNQRSPLETTVLYITSDAGEGKTSLINEIARHQAERFLNNASDWLLVPIPLGGRHFLRFDDITIGALQNRYRFPFLYYNSFIALVRMGTIVPAFDGFEEMFVEGSSGEALSAMGILVGSLDSQGAMVVAARRAYFEFENLRSQQRLFDTIRTYSVGFAKLDIRRWEKEQFVEYCKKRRVANADELYRRISERLTPEHSLLTRAVLVTRLVDIAASAPSLDGFLQQIQRSGADYFSVFVRSLIEREAHDKWIDRSGEKEMATPLLTVEEHCDLLSQVALAMWEARVDHLKLDALAFVADYFSEEKKKTPHQAHQIRERLRGHALLIPSANAPQAIEFDHDEFRQFFLGEGLANQCRFMNDRAKAEALSTLRRGILPHQAQLAFTLSITRDLFVGRPDIVRFLLDVCKMDSQASYTQENCSVLVPQLLSGVDGSNLEISHLSFGTDALRDRKLGQVKFRDSYFAPTSLEHTELANCSFVKCTFTQFRDVASSRIVNVSFDRCSVESLVLGEERETWDPLEIRSVLESRGVTFVDPVQMPIARDETEREQALRDFGKILRYFMRSTHISESVILLKLGDHGRVFIDQVLPRLLEHGVVKEIENRGGGDQRRFRLAMPIETLSAMIAAARGSFSSFLEQARSVKVS